MNSIPPAILTILDALGLSLSFWLALHLASHGWGWSRARATQAAFAFAGLAVLFGVAAWDDLHNVAGSQAANGWLRLFLLFFPVGWLGFARRLMPPALRNRTLIPALVVSLLALLPFAVTLQTVWLVDNGTPFRPNSWYFLPAYLVYALAALGLTFYNTLDARSLIQNATERSVLFAYAFASMVAMVAVTLIASDLVFGLNNTIFPPQVQESAFVLRLGGSAGMLLATVLLWYLVHTQASADGALHLSAMRVSFLITVVLAGGAVTLVVYLTRELPFTEQMVAIVLLFALTADWFIQSLRSRFERLFYRGESGVLRQTLYRVLDALDPVYGDTPPAIRPLINNLSRQLNVPQLGVALADSKDPRKFRISVATNPKWEKSELPVTSLDVWHERGHDGWNLPLRKDGRTVGMIASSGSRQLSRVQEKLLEEAGKEIVHLMEQWQQLASRRQQLQSALDSYWKDEEAFERYSLSMVTDIGPTQDLRKQLRHLFNHYGDPQVFSGHPLTRLKLIESVASSATATSRGETLRSILNNLIDQLRPAKTSPPENPTGEWVPYVVMAEIYLKGTARETVMGRLHLAPDALKRVEGAAITQLAHLLSELEAAVLRREQRVKREAALRAAPASKPAQGSVYSPSTGNLGTSSGFGGSSTYGGNYGSTTGKVADKKSGGLTGGLGGLASGLSQRLGRSDGKKDTAKAAAQGEAAKSGGIGALFNRNKPATPPPGKMTPKPVDGSDSLKGRFGEGLAKLGSGISSRLNPDDGKKAPATPPPPTFGTATRGDRHNAPTNVNPLFARKAAPPPANPTTPSSPGTSGFVRPAPKPSPTQDSRARRAADPYGYDDDFPEPDFDDDDFDKYFKENN